VCSVSVCVTALSGIYYNSPSNKEICNTADITYHSHSLFVIVDTNLPTSNNGSLSFGCQSRELNLGPESWNHGHAQMNMHGRYERVGALTT